MYYSPHTLYKREDAKPSYDENGNPVFAEGDYTQIGECRCDDANIQEMKDVNGQLYRPSYKIVTEKPISIECGEYVRVMDGEDVRGEGKVRNIHKCNWYKYVTIWV